MSVLHVVPQLAEAPGQRYGEQLGLPTAALASSVQVPSAVAPRATVQASQAPEQALLQHTLSEQAFVRHWLFAVHAAPCADRATQTLPLQ